MESLALLVAFILLTMLVMTVAALGLSFVGKRWARVASLVCSLPAGGIAVQLLTSVQSTGALVMGLAVGAVVIYTWVRNIKFLRAPIQS